MDVKLSPVPLREGGEGGLVEFVEGPGHAPASLRLSCKTHVLPSGSLKSANEP
jgi:hypothetical protein